MTAPFADTDAARVADWLGDTKVQEVPAVRVACGTEQEWLDARLSGVGASEVGIILGVSSWSSPYALWWRKKLDWRIPRTEAQRWGHLVEDPIADLFAEDHPELLVVRPNGHPYSLWCHPKIPWMTCTPDRLAVDADGRVSPVEIKSDEGGKGWGEPGTDEVPAHHRLQLAWQACIFGADGGWVVRRRGSGKGRTAAYWVPFDRDGFADVIAQCRTFLESIQSGDAPEPDGSKSTTEALKEINPAIDEGEFAEVPREIAEAWIAARIVKGEALAEDALATNRMRQAMGRAEYATFLSERGDLQIVVAKRRIGKRAGYAVGPAQTDELRVIGNEQRSAVEGLRSEADRTAGATATEQGNGDGDPAGT